MDVDMSGAGPSRDVHTSGAKPRREAADRECGREADARKSHDPNA
jgi:hypothetical protein